MPSNYMSHKMGSSCPLIPSKPQAAFKQITHFLPSQKSYNGSFTSHFEFKRTFARPREHSKMVPVNLFAFGLVTRDVQVDNEEDKAANSMQPTSHDSDEEKEGTQSTSIADTSLLLAIHEEFAGLNVSKEPTFATQMLQASDMNEFSRIGHAHSDALDIPLASSEIIQAQKERMMKKKTQQLTYLFAALASSVGITSLAGASVYCRFAWQMQGGEVPWTEMCGTFSLALGAAVGMEYWARWAHRALWHASLWSMHESHHQPRDGPFELNDVFAIINAIPAIALMAFGFFNKGLVPGLCFGAGLGITVFGIAYMFVHDGLVHRRFPVGPIADVPYFQKVAAAHQLHHADKFNGVPYGLFLGPMELEEVGGRTELEKVLQKRKRENKNPING